MQTFTPIGVTVVEIYVREHKEKKIQK